MSSVIEEGPLKLSFDGGTAKMYYKGAQIVERLDTVFQFGEFYYESSEAEWQAQETGDKKIIAIGRWKDKPVSQRWELEILNNHQIDWKVKVDLGKETDLCEGRLALFLPMGYKEWLDSYEKGQFDRVPIWAKDSKVVFSSEYVGTRGVKRKDKFLPALLLDFPENRLSKKGFLHHTEYKIGKHGGKAVYNYIATSLYQKGPFVFLKNSQDLAWLNLWPVFLAFIYKIFGYSFSAGRITLAILSSLTCAVVYILGKEIACRKAGIFSALLAAFYLRLILYSVSFEAETLFLFLFLPAMLFLVKGITNPTLSKSIIAGIFLGLSILVRSSVIAFPVFLFFWLLFFTKDNRKKILRSISITILITGLVILPWMLTVTNFSGCKEINPFYVRMGQNLWMGNNVEANGGFDPHAYYAMYDKYRIMGLSDSEVGKQCFRRGLGFILHNPGLFCKLIPQKLKHFFADENPYFYDRFNADRIGNILGYRFPMVSYRVILFLSIIGFAFSFMNWRRFQLLVLFIFYYLGIIIIFYATERARIIIAPFLCIFAGYALSCFIDIFLNFKRKLLKQFAG